MPKQDSLLTELDWIKLEYKCWWDAPRRDKKVWVPTVTFWGTLPIKEGENGRFAFLQIISNWHSRSGHTLLNYEKTPNPPSPRLYTIVPGSKKPPHTEVIHTSPQILRVFMEIILIWSSNPDPSWNLQQRPKIPESTCLWSNNIKGHNILRLEINILKG